MSSSEGTSGRDCAADNATLIRRGVKSIDYTHCNVPLPTGLLGRVEVLVDLLRTRVTKK